jgi:anti-sigma factor ChrR (cupin superfamily)
MQVDLHALDQRRRLSPQIAAVLSSITEAKEARGFRTDAAAIARQLLAISKFARNQNVKAASMLRPTDEDVPGPPVLTE